MKCLDMKKDYNFFIDTHVKVWRRDSYIVEADSVEEAEVKIKELFKSGELDGYYDDNGICWDEQEYLQDYEEYFEPELEGRSTCEVWFQYPEEKDCKMYSGEYRKLCDNKPIDIVRGEKLDALGI